MRAGRHCGHRLKHGREPVGFGAKWRGRPEVARIVVEMMRASKPVAAVCIAPALIAAICRDAGIECSVTIGADAETAGAIVAPSTTGYIPRESDGTSSLAQVMDQLRRVAAKAPPPNQ